MTDYIFDDHHVDGELQRLRLIEETIDPLTISHLQQTGIQTGWRCLEVGGGAGSIMRWMGDAVGDSGQVIGVDRRAGYIRELSHPPFQVVEADFVDAALDGEFDLAHERYVLIHNAHRHEMLDRMCRLLKPGGFLVTEEPDFTSAILLDRSGDDSQKRVSDAICHMFEGRDLDAGFALDLPQRIVEAGLQIIQLDARLHLAHGNSPVALMMGKSARALTEKYIATGKATEDDIDRYVKNSEDERFLGVYYTTVAVIARK